MPVYEYIAKDIENSCKYCRHKFEVIQKNNEPPLQVCPECKNPVKKIVSFQFGFTGKSEKQILSNKNLAKHGFQKFVKNKSGGYDKIV